MWYDINIYLKNDYFNLEIKLIFFNNFFVLYIQTINMPAAIAGGAAKKRKSPKKKTVGKKKTASKRK
jgi:hypothetical protein